MSRTDILTKARFCCYLLVAIVAVTAANTMRADAQADQWSYTMPACFTLTLEDQRLGPQQNEPLTAEFGTFPQAGETYDLTEADVPLLWQREWTVLRVIHLHGAVGARIWVN